MRLDFSFLASSWSQLAEGIMATLFIATVSFLGALVIGYCLTILRLSGSTAVRRTGTAYVALFRVIPELGVIFWSYYCLPILLGLSLSEFTCGILALTAIGAAYTSEIFRAGYNALPRGQLDAARALGLREWQAWRLVLAPQILRRTMPALINCGIDTLKNSTLLAAIGASELAYQAYQIGNSTYNYLAPFTFVAAVFFLIIFPLSLLSRRREAMLQSRSR